MYPTPVIVVIRSPTGSVQLALDFSDQLTVLAGEGAIFAASGAGEVLIQPLGLPEESEVSAP